MNHSKKIALQIGCFTFLCGSVFFIVSLYWYQDVASYKSFLMGFLTLKNISLLIFLAFFSLFIGVLTGYYTKYIFQKIEHNNDALKNYNHYLAHELKTPISVLYSHLDILALEYSKQRVQESKKELQSMISIIDGLLNYSESLHLGDTTVINVENFLKSRIAQFAASDTVVIHNTLFNFTLTTQALLFERIIINIIKNALLYSTDGKLHIFIHTSEITFKNNMTQTYTKKEIELLKQKSFSKSFEQKRGHGIGLPMIEEISKKLGYTLEIQSQDNMFIVKLIF